MIKANEILEVTREAVSKKYESKIREAAACRQRCLVLHEEISADEISILKENGYEVVVEEQETQQRRKKYKSTIKW